MQKIIEDSYKKKEKIKDKSKLKQICNYANFIEDINTKIYNIGIISFSYFDICPDILHQNKIRPETIFKINILHICSQLNKYKKIKNMFQDVKINVEFEKSSETCKKYRKNAYIHDAIVSISYKNRIYEIGFEYNEKSHLSKIEQDNMKNIYSIICLDSYNIYQEQNNNYNIFMNTIIFDMLVYICSLTNDRYELAKILYFKDKEICYNEFENVEKILNFKKNNSISIKLLFDSFIPFYKNANNEIIEYTYEEYKKFLIDDIDIKIINDNCDFDNYVNIICNTNQDNESITTWNNIYNHTLSKFVQACEEIIKLNTKMNIKKDVMTTFIEDIIKNLQKYPNKTIVSIGINNFISKFGYSGDFSEIYMSKFEQNIIFNNNEKIIYDNIKNIEQIIKEHNIQYIKCHIKKQIQLVIFAFFSIDINDDLVKNDKKKEIQDILIEWINTKSKNTKSNARQIIFEMLKNILSKYNNTK
jgi:hypothetical protein